MNYGDIHNKYNIVPITIKFSEEIVYTGGDMVQHGYNCVYDQYFEPYRNQPIKLAEIGILAGHKLFCHDKFFSNVRLYGYDINLDYIYKYQSKEFIDKLTLTKIDSRNKSDTIKITETFDIIIDDATHSPNTVIKTFENFYPKLHQHGLYIIEDVGQNRRYEPIKKFLDKKYIKHKLIRPEKSASNTGLVIIQNDNNVI